MADAYRGLTIRFGGDTTALTKALSIANRAIGVTEKNIRTLNKALKLDPGNQASISQRMTLISERSSEAALKVRTLNEAIRQTSGKPLLETGEAVWSVANRTKDASKQVSLLRENYNSVNETLEVTKRQMQQVYSSLRNQGKINGKRWNLFDLDEGDFNKALAAMERLDDRMIGIRTQYKRLKEVHNEYEIRLRDMESIESFKKVKADIQLAKAELRNFAQQAVTEMLTAGSRVEAIGTKFKHVDGVVDVTRTKMIAMRQVAETMPESYDALRNSIRATREYTDALKLSIERSKNELSQLEAKVKGTAAEGKSLSVLQTMFEKANAEAVEAKMRLDGVQAEIDETVVAIGKMRSKRIIDPNTRSDIEAAEKRLEQLRAELKRTEAEFDSTRSKAQVFHTALKADEMRTEIARMNAELEKTKGELHEDVVKAKQFGNEVKSAAKKGEDGFTKMGDKATSSIRGIASSLQSVGSALMGTFSMYASQFFYRSVSAAETFDSAFRSMTKTVNGTENEFKALRDAAIEFGNTHAISADTILEIESLGGQLGIAVENLQAFAEVASNLSISTNISAEDIAQEMGQLSGIVGEAEFNFESFGDALTRLGNNAPALESSIMQVNMRVASMGSLFGFTVPEMLAWSTAVAATGQGAEAAGTAISKTMSDINSFVGEGGDKLNQLASIAGMTADEFSNAWTKNASSAMFSFVSGLRTMNREGKSADAALEGLGITSVRQKQALLGLTQTVGSLDKYLMLANDAYDGLSTTMSDGRIIEAGDAAREAEKRAAGFSGAIQILKNNSQELMVEFSESMAPAIRVLTSVIGKVAEVFKNLGPVGQGSIVGITVALMGLGPALRVAGGFLVAYESIVNYVGKSSGFAATSIVKMKDALKGVVSRITGLSNVTALGALGLAGFATAAAAAVAALVISEWKKYHEQLELIRKSTKGLVDSAKGLADAMNGSNLSIGKTTKSVSECREELNNLRKANADLAESTTDVANNAGASVYALEQARNTIVELGNHSVPLTSEEYARLSTAVALVNDECGTQIKITDEVNGTLEDENGAIQDVTGSIDEYIDARQRMIKIDAYSDIAAQYESDIASANVAIENATRGYNDAALEFRTLYNDDISKYLDPSVDISMMDLNFQALVGRARGFREEIDSENELLLSLKEGQRAVYEQMGLEYAAANGLVDDISGFLANKKDVIEGILSEQAQTITSFQTSLQGLGIGKEFLASLSDEQLQEIASKFDGTMTSIILAMNEAGIAASDAGAKVVQDFSKGMSRETMIAAEYAAGVANVSLAQFMMKASEFGIAGEEGIKAFSSAVTKYPELLETSAGVVTQHMREYLTPLADEFGIKGDEAIDAFCNAIVNGSTKEEAARIAQEVVEAMDVADEVGQNAENATNEYSGGLTSGSTKIRNAATNAVGILGEVSESQGSAAMTWGEHLIDNFASGMTNNSQAIVNASTYMASVIKSYIGHSVPDKGPLSDDDIWGYHFAQNIASGIDKGREKIGKSILGITDIMEQAMPSNFDYQTAVYGGDIVANIPGTVYDVSLDSQIQANEVLAQTLIGWLDENLGPTIADYTPTATNREMGRMVRRVY